MWRKIIHQSQCVYTFQSPQRLHRLQWQLAPLLRVLLRQRSLTLLFLVYHTVLEVLPPVASGRSRSSLPHCDQNYHSDNSDNSTRESFIHFPLSSPLEQPQRKSSSAELPNTHDLRPRLPPRDYHKEAVQNKKSPKVRCIPVKVPESSLTLLTRLEKRAVILDS